MKKILILILILIINFFSSSAFSRTVTVRSDADVYCANGDKILNYYEKLKDKTNGEKYLTSAKYFYYQASRLDMSNINPFIGRARVALIQENTKDARNNLMMALNINEFNPKVNFWLGETFFAEGEFSEAIIYYNKAYNNGYKYDYRTNLRLGICYEKIDEADKARLHYKNAVRANKGSVEAQARLTGLDTINTNYKDFNAFDRETEEAEAVTPEDLQNLNLPAL